MILTDRQIKKRVSDAEETGGTLGMTIKPFYPEAVQPASYDFHLSPHFAHIAFRDGDTIDLMDAPRDLSLISEEFEKLLLKPGQFVLAQTMEWFSFPDDVAGMVKDKSSLGRLGFTCCPNAGWVDPGFRGRIVLELKNFGQNAIRLYAGMPIGQMVFHQTAWGPDAGVEKNYAEKGGHYSDQHGFNQLGMKISLRKAAQSAWPRYYEQYRKKLEE